MNGGDLAKAHWEYVENLLTVHEVDKVSIDMIGFHYKSAFIHGFKHGVEEKQGEQ